MRKTRPILLLASGLLLPLAVSAQWANQQPPRGIFSLTDVHFTDADHGFASAAIGGLIKTIDGGQTWTNVPTGVQSSLRDVHFASPDTGYVVGNVGVVIGTTDGGTTWTHHDLPNNGSSVNGVYFHSGRHGFITQGDVILSTEDGGTTWDSAYVYNGTIPVFTFRFLEFPTPLVGYAVGGYSGSFGNVGEIAKTTDGGRTWQLIPSMAAGMPMGAASAVAFPNDRTGYVADVSNRLFCTFDGGQTWRIVTQNTFGAFYGMYFTDAQTGYGVGYNGNLRRTTDGGFTWQDQSLNTLATYAAVYFPTPQQGFAVGDTGGGTAEILKYTSGPTGLPQAPASVGIEVAPNPATDVVRLAHLPAAGTTATLLDLAGRTVRRTGLTGTSGTLTTADVAPGLYLLRLETGGRTFQQKLVVE